MSKKQERIDGLSDELLSVHAYMKYRTFLPLPPTGGRKKNSRDSIRYRQKGNFLYKNHEIHNETIHEQIWRMYSQSIALAPNNSEELACGYGNRSALLFHIEKFRECIQDCDNALRFTNSDLLKMKLLSRKAECLFLLNEPAMKDVSKEALHTINKFQLDYEAVRLYDEKLQNILSACHTINGKIKLDNEKLRNKYFDDLLNFPRSEEVPCASKSIAICHNKTMGRHIIATENIKPGEIFSMENNYYTFISRDGMYLYCSNCARYVWSSIPCEHCIYDVYCSESCRSEAWNKYHQWECTIYPHLWDINENNELFLFVMRFVFTAISEVGGIENMKKIFIELDKCKDPRTKAFSGSIFRDDTIRSIFSLMKHKEIDDPFIETAFTEQFCIGAYLIAKYTTFFGQKMNMPVSEVFKIEDVVFFAALLLHSHHIIHFNGEHYGFLRNGQFFNYATTVRAFVGLINHDCDPNVSFFMTERNTTVGYAIKPIKKGTQLVISYSGKCFLDNTKEERQDFLKRVYKFTCKCLACTENRSNICLPDLQEMYETTPDLQLTMEAIVNNMSTMKSFISEKQVVNSPKLMADIVYFLESTAEKVTTHCEMYQSCLECLKKMFFDVFGSFIFTLPGDCFTNSMTRLR